MAQKTIKEYEKAVEILVRKVKELDKKYKSLKIRYQLKKEMADKIPATSYINQLTEVTLNYCKNAVKIQKIWRGYSQREKFKKQLIFNIERNNTLRNITQKEKDMQVISLAYSILAKQFITFEMLFRCLDKDYIGKVNAEEYQNLFNKFVSDSQITQGQKCRLFYLFDEECTGYITKVELFQSLAGYGVPTEGDLLKGHPRTMEQEMLLKFAFLIRQKQMTAEQTYRAIDKKNLGCITQHDISEFIKSMNWRYSQKELMSLMLNLDVESQTYVEKSFFIAIVGKALDHKVIKYICENQQNKGQIK